MINVLEGDQAEDTDLNKHKNKYNPPAVDQNSLIESEDQVEEPIIPAHNVPDFSALELVDDE